MVKECNGSKAGDAYLFNMNSSVAYFSAGEFSADPGWTHRRALRADAFGAMIGLRGRFSIEINYEGSEEWHECRIVPSACMIFPPRASFKGIGRTDEPVHFIWFQFLASDWTRISFDSESDDYIDIFRRIASREQCDELSDSMILPIKPYFLQDLSKIVLPARTLLSCANSYRFSGMEADCLMKVLLLEISDDFLQSKARSVGIEERTERVVEWVRSHMSSNLSVSKIASHFRMNSDYLTRLFKAERGETLRDYLLHLRVDTAKVLLTRTKYPIAKVGSYSYFSSPKNFLKQFKNCTGLTPSEYRRQFSATNLNNPTIEAWIPVLTALIKDKDD